MKLTLSAGLVLLACCLGQALPQARVAGGEDAVPGQLPYQAALSIGGSYNCGAVIIAERYALTALTCVCSEGKNKPWSANLFGITFGSVDLYTGGKEIRVEEITINPNYNTLKTGLALLRLKESIVFNENVSPVPLARVDPPVGAQVEISGYGRTTESEVNMHRTLQIGQASVVQGRECRLGKSDEEPVDNDQVLCLGHERRNGICRGDMGGPAVYQQQLVGLGGEMLGECGGLLPERFISIPANYDWIQQNIQ
ncbi:serine protease SP24D [Drosophila subobscura]|uniref:serine protease SP24D n=1 Tax=Drosophila subobscura TaxID=7241 RepID=UPI00155A2D43|nr:serine protease SP24D [Drosophila subobscura]